jgi:hypothetical protein
VSGGTFFLLVVAVMLGSCLAKVFDAVILGPAIMRHLMNDKDAVDMLVDGMEARKSKKKKAKR